MDCQQEGDEANLYVAWGRRCRPFIISVECDVEDEPDEGVLFQIVAVVKWTYTASLCPLLFLKIKIHWNIQLTVWQLRCPSLCSLIAEFQRQRSKISAGAKLMISCILNFLKKKKKKEIWKKVMNGLFLDGSSGQNTQTPRDRHKRCYSLKLLTHQAASRSYMWHIICNDPKNTVVSINSLSPLSDLSADMLLHPAEMLFFFLFCLRNSWMLDWIHSRTPQTERAPRLNITHTSLAQQLNLINISTAVNFLLSFITALLHTCVPAKCHD